MTEETNTPSTRRRAGGKPRPKTTRAKTPSGRRRRSAPSQRRTPSQGERLEELIYAVTGGAARTGRKIAAVSERSATAARRAAGRASRASRQAARRIVAQWNRLDTPRKIEFMATLLGAAAAASAGIAGVRKKK